VSSTGSDGDGYRAVMPRARPLAVDPIDEARRHWTTHGWDDAAAGMAVLTSVMRVQQIFAAQVDDVLRPFGLTFSRYEVLMLLSFTRRGALPLGKLGERLQVHAASITNAIDRLEQQGLVQRRPHPSDGRAVLARITPAGRRLADKATAAINREVFGTLELSAREHDDLYRLLRKIRAAAGDFDA